MKGRILGSLFALPFFGVGVWMLWAISNNFYDVWDMQDWHSVEARLSAAGYTTNSGDDSDSYEAYASYSYTFFGQTFQGDRVSLSSGADNIGDYQQDTGQRLSNAMSRNEHITVWVNPDNPSESIVDRSLRWGLLGFKSIFLFVFGGVGLGLLIAIWRAPKEKDKTKPEYQSAPWLLNHDWQSASIRSDSKMSMWGAWAFAAIWNLISAPTPFLAYREVVDKENYIALAALLFPVVGIGLIGWAVKRTKEWRKFGPTPVELDPFPGSIGGHVGGTIEMPLGYDSSNKFLLTLTSLHSYMSGSGKNRRRTEQVLWQDEALGHSESTGTGTRIEFRFDVPSGKKESDADPSDDSYDLWRLNVRAEIDGTDLDRSYEIPVFATGEESSNISDRNVERSDDEQNAVYDSAVRKHIHISNDGMGKKFAYAMGRNIVSNSGAILIGGTFAAIGWYIAFVEHQRLFGFVFGGTGMIVAIAAFYMLFKSLDVSIDSGNITSVRRLLGFPIRTRSMRLNDLDRLEVDNGMQAQTGTRHIVYLKVKAINRSGNKLLLGDGFKGTPMADAAVRLFENELGFSDSF
jgi:hypothetical protein